MDRFSRGCMGRTRNMAVLSPVRNVKIVFFITTFLLNTSSQKKGRLSTSPFFFLRAFQAGVPRVSPRGEDTRDEAKRTRLGFFWEIQQHSTVCRCDLSKISSPRVAGFFFCVRRNRNTSVRARPLCSLVQGRPGMILALRVRFPLPSKIGSEIHLVKNSD